MDNVAGASMTMPRKTFPSCVFDYPGRFPLSWTGSSSDRDARVVLNLRINDGTDPKMSDSAKLPHHPARQKDLTHAALALLTTVVFLELLLASNWPMQGDISFLHYIAYLINEHGFLPYRDVFEFNMPGTYLFHMTAGKLFGYNDRSLQLVNGLWLLAILGTTWLILSTAGRLVALAGCLLFSLMYFGGGPALMLQRDVVAILPIAAAALLANRQFQAATVPLIHFLTGALLACAALFKPHLAIGLPVFIVFNSFNARPDTATKVYFRQFLAGSALTGAGFIAVFVLPFTWLWYVDVLPDFVDQWTKYVPLYLNITGDMQTAEGLDKVAYLFKSFQNFGGFGALLAPAALGTYFALSIPGSPEKRLALLSISLAFSYSLYAVISGKFWSYQWMPFVYFLCLSAALALRSEPAPGSTVNGNRSPTIFSIVIFIFAALLAGRPAAYTLRHLANGAPPPPHDGNSQAMADYLTAHSVPGDTVQPLDSIQGGTARALLLTESVLATPYVTDFQFYYSVQDPYVQHLRQDFVRRLTQHRPTFIIDSRIFPKPVPQGANFEFAELRDILKSRYRLVLSHRNFDIYRLHEEP